MVSIYDIANAVGVSASTVSFVLNGRAEKMRISKAKQKMILEAANQMGYIPNMTARKLSLRNIQHMPEIALCWSPAQHSQFLNTFIDMLQDMTFSGEVREMRFTILPYKNGELEKMEPVLSANYYNGIIVPPVSKEDIEFLTNTSIQVPTVLLYGDIPQYHQVSVDNLKIGTDIAAIFNRHGHKSVGVMQPVYKHSSITINQRISGFMETSSSLRMEAKLITSGLDSPSSNKVEEGKIAAKKMIEENNLPSAIYIQNDSLALGALSVFGEHGIRIPEDMEIIVYGNNDSLEIHHPSITTVNYPTEEIARTCITLMANALDMPGTAPVRKIIDTPFVFRKSCPL
ncbi:LacI family DNA-binding transcriptional regulator [Clostridium sp. BNL1100]|uniref:LacI family DNA-binding transcriptional regulator n=1 Tax=Clostridium sp. BNL1100 TaxID=755731 RepID=UPI00024A741B|nr:LacI family DNA-binding transcriptional regulator [Clostridium sp. BNL1100]AEY67276.1 transcriptional regulator [Clostridium sp. BNL1100]